MSTDLLTYFNQRFSETTSTPSGTGKFVTISRQTGCNGTIIAEELTKALARKGSHWKFINKEILEQSARKLKLEPSKLQYVFENKKKSHIDDVISALSSRYYKSDKVVRKTITEVLRYYAAAGNVIIVGRAGVATTRDMTGGLHIRLIAPFEWRYASLKERKKSENENLTTFIREHDINKNNLIRDFAGKSVEEIEFDLTINCGVFTRQQVIDLILTAMEMKGITGP